MASAFDEYGFLEIPVTSSHLKQEYDPFNLSKAASLANNLFSTVFSISDVHKPKEPYNLNKVENVYISFYGEEDICECMNKYFDHDDYEKLPCKCTLKFIEAGLMKSPTLLCDDTLEAKEQRSYPKNQEEKLQVVIQSCNNNNNGCDFDDLEEEDEFWYLASFQRFKRANGRSRTLAGKLQVKKETKVRKVNGKNLY